MMGRDHARWGAVLLLGGAAAAAQMTGALFAGDLLLATCQASGYALLPDIDSAGALATRAFPPVTYPLHWIVTWIHRMVYAATRRDHDPPSRVGGKLKPRFKTVFGSAWLARRLFGLSRGWRSAHRGITHSIPTAALVGTLSGLLAWWHPLAAVFVIAAGVLIGGAVVFAAPVVLIYGLSVLVEYGYQGILPHIAAMAPLWGVAVFIGLLSHDLGDGCTTSGVPLWAPFTWRTYRAPLHFKTNGWFEQTFIKWILYAMMAYFVWILLTSWYPGFLQAIFHLLAPLFGK